LPLRSGSAEDQRQAAVDHGVPLHGLPEDVLERLFSAAIPAAGFEVTRGEPVIGGIHGPEAHHYFCPYCMTWMFTKPEGMD